jgi:hypothetical protein
MKDTVRVRVGTRIYDDIQRIADREGETISWVARDLILEGFRSRYRQANQQDHPSPSVAPVSDG